jgi:hypothetical protein
MNVTHIIVMFRCSDGTLRVADLPPNKAKRVKGFITQEQGGTLTLRKEPVTVKEFKALTEIKPEDAPSAEEAPVTAATS